MDTMKDRLADILRRCDEAALAAGRRPQEITLLAATKGNDASVLREAIGLGQRRFGENYLSEALRKIDALRDETLEWSHIGRIDSNKTRQIAENFDWVLGLSSVQVAQRLDAHRPRVAPPLQACIQVNIDDDPNKGGVPPTKLPALVDAIGDLHYVRLRGLMAIPREPVTGDPGSSPFSALAAVFRRYVADGHEWDTLSMGMSEDFEAAIAVGATQVRVGRALFGERPRKGIAHENVGGVGRA
jgi:PLP dependent protein